MWAKCSRWFVMTCTTCSRAWPLFRSCRRCNGFPSCVWFFLSFLVSGCRSSFPLSHFFLIKSTSPPHQINFSPLNQSSSPSNQPSSPSNQPSPLHLITSTCSILCFLHSFKSEINTSIVIRGLPQASFLFENHYLLHDEGVRTTQIPLIL